MMKKRIPDLLAEQAYLGELPQETEQNLDGHELAGRMQEIADSDREILARYTPADMAARIAARAAETEVSVEPSSKGRILSFTAKAARIVPLAAAALLVAAFALGPVLGGRIPMFQNFSVDAPESTRIKGQPALKVYLKNGSEPLRLRDGDRVRENDMLQVFYNAGDLPFGMILSIDGRGYVTTHLPASQHESTKLQMGGDVSTGYGFALDDAPGFERFFFVQAETPLNAHEVLVAAYMLAQGDARRGSLALPEGYRQLSVTLVKEDK